MRTNKWMQRVLCMLLVSMLLISLIPANVFAASSGREADTIFFATDRHEETSKLNSLLKALAYAPGLVVLGGDHVNNTNSGSLASITSEIQSVYPGVQTFYTYAAHDPNVSEDSSNPYAYARTGEYYEGEDYYVYGVDQDHMQSASNAAAASASFKSWADTIDSSKVIFVMCHMPIHSRRGDNAGGATWMNALNEVGQSHDIVYLWGHNHTGENSTDTSVYFVGVGGSLTPQGGSTGTINFTYMNAGYIKNGYCSMAVLEDDAVHVTRYSTSGSATANYTIERRFAQTHVWEVVESVAATCDSDGYELLSCADCGETKTTVIPAVGHDYTEEIRNTCTGSFTVYTCGVCGDRYSEANPTETTYDRATSLVEGESYVVVSSNYALTYGSSAGKTSVTVSNNAITSNVTDAMIWTYENGVLYNEANGKYINYSGSSSRKTITFSTSGVSASYSSNKLKLGSYYLYYSSSSGFSARSSGSTVTLYQVNEAVGGTGEHTYESVTVEPTCTENGSVTYTCTSCGDSYAEILPANGSHSYTAETTEATCTENGSIVYTCFCGDTYAEVIPALGHTYESVTTEATCTENGSIVCTCACGDTYTEVIPALGHSYESAVTAPTCTESGYTTYTCVCGDSYIADETAALGHSYESTVTAPTCTESGYTTYTCVCGDSYIADETAALGHSYESAVTAPTCTESGGTTYTCHCGHSYVADQVAALGHDLESVVTEATCTTAGYTTHTCRRCGEVTVDGHVAALGHDLQTVIVEATCTESGSVTEACARCGETHTEVIPAKGHSHEAVVTAPTCIEGGYTTYTCVCGDSYVADEVAALGHTYASVTTEATCTENGSVVYTCRCGETYTEVIPAKGHSYEAVVTAPTCTENGFTTYTCACGDSYIADETAAQGHSHEAVVTAPTCTENGFTTYTCACGDSYVADETAALGHSHEAVVTAPTCTESGYTTYTCACGDSYIADETAALGHSHEAVVTAPTCTENGFTTYTCACGDSYTADQVAALGHSYTYVDADGYRVYTCGNCGHSYSEKLSSSYSQVSAFVSGERFVITVKSSNKYYALSHSGNSISAVQVQVSGGEITSEITEDLLWTYADGKLSYVSGGTTYYLYTYTSGWWFWSSTELGISASESDNVSISGTKLKIDSKYLRYSSGKLSVSSSAGSAYIFQES